jgi:hypothetical protein
MQQDNRLLGPGIENYSCDALEHLDLFLVQPKTVPAETDFALYFILRKRYPQVGTIWRRNKPTGWLLATSHENIL